MSESIEFIEIYRTQSASEIAFIESLLISCDIPYFIENDNVSRMSLAGGVPFKVRVHEDREREAREILREVIKPLTGSTS